MARLEQIGDLVSEQLRERVDRLVSAVEDDASDLADIAALADAVGEFADTIAEIYSNLEQTLMNGLSRASESDSLGGEKRSRRERQSQQPKSNDTTDQGEMTKEELLEQARELNIHGRSAMDKDELAQAVETEESVTKDELLDRAREAGIEGRSSMSKEELRDALREAGV